MLSQVHAMMEMIIAYISGKYTDISYTTLVALVAALVYPYLIMV